MDMPQIVPPRLPHRTEVALERVSQWIGRHPGAWVSLSGGKDSAVVAHLALTVAPTTPLVFFDSGLEYPQTYAYLDQVAAHYPHTTIHTVKARPDALTVLRDSGAWEHGTAITTPDNALYNALILHPLIATHATHGAHNLYGLRQQESTARRILLRKTAGNVTKQLTKDATLTSDAPIHQWTWQEVWAYTEHHGLPTNPLYKQLAALGVARSRSRVAHIIDGDGLDKSRWAIARQLAPSRARQIEQELPLLREFR